MAKIYPSAAAFALGEMIITEYSSGCLRSVLWQSWGAPRGDIPEEYKKRGQAHEAYYARSLKSPLFGPEIEVKGELDGVPYSGRADFITMYREQFVVHECKSTDSKGGTKKKAIDGGKPKLNHLAQLAFYMRHFETDKAILDYGAYDPVDVGKGVVLYKLTDGRKYKITINAHGGILADGQGTGYTIQDQLAHTKLVARTLKEERVPDRPYIESKWNSPCRFCDYADLCVHHDKEGINSKEEMLDVLTKQGVIPCKPASTQKLKKK